MEVESREELQSMEVGLTHLMALLWGAPCLRSKSHSMWREMGSQSMGQPSQVCSIRQLKPDRVDYKELF
ncbi:hypothetical protein PRIPAC_78083 [Pristionchus pacificus]|uniref:Uncharacterized protein n=1 Tax=Pristionchus pacificus TaxID=54126 RepID=A0A2A6BY34_PRIPA|nr:hypothetical protein PRIPAC_78083 [Pristionchus pacificus]|eukprot:PDM70766.1 hypothetical protein PRIPAC_44970 [Pristionchus pacificus]